MAEHNEPQDHINNRNEVIEKLKQNARQWVDVDEKERKKKEELKKLKQEKDELSEWITTAMTAVQESNMKISTGGFLKCTETTTYAPVNKEKVFSYLVDELKSEERARDICDKLYDKDSRDVKKTMVLKRTKR